MANYTLNYTGEKVDELLNKIDTAFGETTVMGDTLTWDGEILKVPFIDPTGTGQVLLCRISDTVPTSDDFANGAKLVFANGNEQELTANEILSLGNGVLTESNFNFVIVPNDNTTITAPYGDITLTVTFPKKGVYFGIASSSSYTQSLIINGYTGFANTEIETMDPKFMPDPDIVFTFETLDTNPQNSVATCNKTFEELETMSIEKLATGVAKRRETTSEMYLKVQNVTRMQVSASLKLIAFEFFRINAGIEFFVITVQNDGTITVGSTIM